MQLRANIGGGWGGGGSLIAESRQFFSKDLELCVCVYG